VKICYVPSLELLGAHTIIDEPPAPYHIVSAGMLVLVVTGHITGFKSERSPTHLLSFLLLCAGCDAGIEKGDVADVDGR
jgi:hypothetical protein